jgi:hypothetical protein
MEHEIVEELLAVESAFGRILCLSKSHANCNIWLSVELVRGPGVVVVLSIIVTHRCQSVCMIRPGIHRIFCSPAFMSPWVTFVNAALQLGTLH